MKILNKVNVEFKIFLKENLRMNKGNEMENLIRHRLNEMKEVERSEEEKKEWERIITFFFFLEEGKNNDMVQ